MMCEDLRLVANLHIRVEDARGTLVDLIDVHNTWLNRGRTFILQLMTYNMYPGYVIRALPPDPEPLVDKAPLTRTVNTVPASTASVYQTYRIFQTAVGIGGNQQTGPIPSAVNTDYGPVTNAFANGDVTLVGLECPVRVRTDGLRPVVAARWTKPLTAITLPGMPSGTSIHYITTYDLLDVNTAGLSGGNAFVHGTVPLSEIALYPWTNASLSAPAAPPAFVTNNAVAYATYRTINKTQLVRVIYDWEIILS